MADTGFAVVPLTGALIPGAAELERLCFSSPWSEQALALYLSDAFAFAAVSPAGPEPTIIISYTFSHIHFVSFLSETTITYFGIDSHTLIVIPALMESYA